VYDEEKDQFICPALLAASSPEKGNMSMTVSRCTLITVRTAMNVHFAQNAPVRREDGSSPAMGMRRNGGGWPRRCDPMWGKRNTGTEKRRSSGVFGDMKQNMKFREFLTRDTKGARMEHNLVCTGHNLKIVWGKLGRNVPALGKIGGSFVNLASQVCGLTGLSYSRKLLVCSQD